MKNFVENIVKNQIDPDFLQHTDKEKVYQYWTNQLRERLSLNQIEVLRQRLKQMAINGAVLHDFEEKKFQIEIPGQHQSSVLAGIRFLSGNRDLPFIEIETDFPIQAVEQLRLIQAAITNSFRVFEPKFISFWTSAQTEFTDKKNISKGRQYVAGFLNDLKLDSSDYESPISLERLESLDFFPWYEDQYEKFHSDFPLLKDKVPINSKDCMQVALEQGLMFEARLGTERIGLIAAEAEHFMGIKAIYMLEILVDKKYRTKGYGKTLEKKFLQQQQNKFDLVWGTIDSSNLGSLGAALSLGRKPIRTEYFFALS